MSKRSDCFKLRLEIDRFGRGPGWVVWAGLALATAGILVTLAIHYGWF